MTEKLIRRHPHVFGEAEAADRRSEVLRNWDAIKRDEAGREPGLFGEVPENLPVAAARAQGPAPRRLDAASISRRRRAAAVACATSSTSSSRPTDDRDERFHELGDVLFAAVNVARKLKLDPELALRVGVGPIRGARAGGGRAGGIRRRELGRSPA